MLQFTILCLLLISVLTFLLRSQASYKKQLICAAQLAQQKDHDHLALETNHLNLVSSVNGLLKASSLSEAVALVAEILSTSYRFQMVWIDMVDPKNQSFERVGEVNLDQAARLTHSQGFELSAQVLATHKARLWKGLAEEADPLSALRTLLSLPLGSDQHWWGVLHLADSREHQLSATELEDFKLLASTLSLAINHLRNCEHLRIAESENRALGALFHDALVTTDAFGCITHLNNSFEDLFGYPLNELLGKNIAIVIPPDEASQHDHYLERYRKTGERHIIGFSREVSIVHKDGRLIPCELTVHEIQIEGSRFFTGLLRDLGERKAAEKSLIEARDQAETAQKDSLQFMENINHALRTPLSGIVGMADLLMETQLQPDQSDYTQALLEASQSMVENLDGLMECSRLESSPGLIEKVAFDPRTLLDEIAEVLTTHSLERYHEVSIQLAPNLSPQVYGDRDRLRQVLLHLAIHFSRNLDQTRILLSAEIQPGPNGSMLSFWFKAASAAIDAHTVTLLTAETLPTTMSMRHEGYFNLQLARRLGDLIGGQIALTQHDQQFELAFSLAIPESKPFASKILEKVRCLILEPQYNTYLALSSLLAPYGCQPEFATNTETALNLLKQAAAEKHPFHMFLLAFESYPESAKALAQAIQENPLLQETRIVLSCHYSHRLEALANFEQGVHHTLIRPLKQKRLVETALNILRQHQETLPVTMLPTQPTLRHHKILVAEDNEINQHLIRKVLGNMGLSFRIANNGVEAVNAVAEESFSLILMDLNMPLMNGLEATRRIREWEDGKGHILIVAMTAEMLKVNRAYCLAHGMDEFLLKPVRVEELTGLIRKLLDGLPSSATQGTS